MLVCLCEINCLRNLNYLGVYPDYFYTDFDAFKEQDFLFQDATILIMFCGSSQFRKRLVLEEAIKLKERAEDKNDMGIKYVYVLSDVQLPTLDDYYRYIHDYTEIRHAKNWEQSKSTVEFWEKLQSPPKESKIILSKYDLGDYSKAKEAYDNRGNTEDEYIKLIKIPEY